jgi:hypothetical protein
MPIEGTYRAVVRLVAGIVPTCDIESDNLDYADFHSHDGLQCNHVGGTTTYNEILERARKVSRLIKEIHELNTTSTV